MHLLEFLVARGADKTPHSGRTLLSHLLGTYDLLVQWGQAPHVCLAGLGHSIYSTTFFRTATWPLDDRMTIRELVGAHAEHLIFLFCVCDRKWKTVKVENHIAVVHDAVNQVERQVSAKDLASLLLIEFANLEEQRRNK